MSDHANNAAAVAAGWIREQVDRGASPPGGTRYFTKYSKQTVGLAGSSGSLTTAYGESNVDQATADTRALAALNAQRGHRYGVAATVNSGHTFDST